MLHRLARRCRREAEPIRAIVLLLVAALAALPVAAALVAPAPVAPAPQRLALPIPPGAMQGVVVPAGFAATSSAEGIGPGSHLILQRPDGTFACTANFVWTDGSSYYLGAAGHCFLPADKSATHGPGADYDRLLTRTRVCVSGCDFGGELGFLFTGNLVELGDVVYARQTLDGVDVGNDFGIVRVPSTAVGLLRPSMPVWGGPRAEGVMAAGDSLCLYGNAAGLGEVFPTMARSGVAILADATSWNAGIASFQGDSGAAVVTCNGADAEGLHGDLAAGILTHLTAAGVAGTSTPRAIAMAREAGVSIRVVTGANGVAAGHRLGALPTFVKAPLPVASASGVIGASALAAGEAEAYRVRLVAGQRFQATIAYEAAVEGVASDLDVGFWPASAWESGTLSVADALDRSASEGGVRETIDATAPATGDYVLVVYGWLVAQETPFALSASPGAAFDGQAYLVGATVA